MQRQPTPAEDLRSYSCSDAAGLLGVTRQTVYRWVCDGLIEAYDLATIPGRPRLRITEKALRDFIESRPTASTTA